MYHRIPKNWRINVKLPKMLNIMKTYKHCQDANQLLANSWESKDKKEDLNKIHVHFCKLISFMHGSQKDFDKMKLYITAWQMSNGTSNSNNLLIKELNPLWCKMLQKGLIFGFDNCFLHSCSIQFK